jgi:type VI secretion system protein ImpA
MPSPPILDFEALLGPIAGDNPAGKDVRYDGTHDAIKEARRADDTLAQGEWVRTIKASDWPAVIELASEALATKSKDVQIASWLVEALVKRYGFPGLRDGLGLLRDLQARFWELLYPEIGDGDLEMRAAPLIWLNERLPSSIREVPLTQGMGGEKYTWLHWKESRDVDNLGRRDQAAMAAALADGKITGEQFDKAVETTALVYHKTLFEDLNHTWQEFEALEQLVDERFGRDAPGLLAIKTAIQDCHTLVREILQKKDGLAPEPLPPEPEPRAERGFFGRLLRGKQELPPQELQDTADRSIRDDPPAVLSLEPQSRADALRRLAAIAEYFRRTEPHSPVAYLVQRAVRWGEMPLEQWLQDVIHDDTVLSHLRETLGIKEPEPHSST